MGQKPLPARGVRRAVAQRIDKQQEHEDRYANTAGVVFAVIGFCLLGLFNRGNNAKLKAGDMLIGYADSVPGSQTWPPMG